MKIENQIQAINFDLTAFVFLAAMGVYDK